jgi:hypothetical protein
VTNLRQIVQDLYGKAEKTSVERKDRKKACAKKWDPYNAPPLTRNNALRRTGQKEKILKFRVDSERGKRNIRHLATVG